MAHYANVDIRFPIQLVSVVIALLALTVSVIVYRGQRRQAGIELARSLHEDLTSGEVAQARDVLGTIRYGTDAERAHIDPGKARAMYFTLLWCFERIAAGRRSLANSTDLGASRAALHFLDDLLQWHLVEWKEGLPAVKETLSKMLDKPLVDRDSRKGFNYLLECTPLPPS